MSASNQFENELMQHIFQNAAIAGIGDAGGLQPSAAPGSLYISLHTSDPGEAGDQTTNEAAYTNYARQAIARQAGAGGWVITANQADAGTLPVSFPQSASGPETITHFGVGTDPSGAGKLLFKGALSASLAVNVNVTPELTTVRVTVD